MSDRVLAGSIVERPSEDGSFDELLGDNVHFHAEMMDDGLLWIRFTPHGAEDAVVVWISAVKRGKLSIRAEVD